MFRRLLFASLALILSFPIAAARRRGDTDEVFSRINSIVAALSDISGLSQLHAVPYGRMNKAQLRRFLAKRIKRTVRPDEIRADELGLKMFGLVPQNFDLKKSTIDLLTEQAAAFYDYDEKKLFLLENSSLESETTTLAHELSHALADQHFDLARFMEEAPANDDENLAHTAVVEGQASWLMIAYDLKENGRPPAPTPEMIASVVNSSESSITDYPVLKASPLYIQQSLVFPYTAGTAFFDAVYKREGKAAFSAVFTHAPSGSAQILHPDRYFEHVSATKPELPKVTSLRNDDEITEGSLGEFDVEMLLWQYLDKARALALAPHLRGGDFKITGSGKEQTPVLTFAAQWDSPEHAADFFQAYRTVLRAKWRRCDVSLDTHDVFAGEGDNGFFVTRLNGDTLSSIEGLTDQDEWRLLKGTAKSSLLKIPFLSRMPHRTLN